MRVSDAMSKHVDFVSVDTKIKEVCRLIFGAGINGVPVCRQRKVVGFITEKDILSLFLPNIKEYVENPLGEGDFEGMEQKVNEILSFPAKKLMSQNPTTINADTPILKAQSLMMIKKVGRLPVVDDKGDLIGIISRGDIFRTVVGDKLPFTSEEKYHDWLSKHYDLVVDWSTRLGNEIPDLTLLFKKEKVKNVIDVGFGTGEHDIALAKKGFDVLGIEASKLMTKRANKKREKLPELEAKRLDFESGDYSEVLKNRKTQYDAAIFMGNALAHIAKNYKRVLESVIKSLNPKHSVLVFQIINYEKVFKRHKGFVEINFAKSKFGNEHQYAFLEFYDTNKKPDDMLTLNMEILNSDGKKWKHLSLNSTQITHIDKEIIEKLLKKYGYKNISFFGSRYLGNLFKDPFDPEHSDWLNVLAVRK